MDPQANKRGLRRWLPVVIVAALVLGLAAAAFWPKAGGGLGDDGKLRIVCSFLPVYVFTLNVVGDEPGVDVQLLIDRNVGCPHSYSLTGQDLKKISRADLFIANGLGAEPFLDQIGAGRPDLKVLTISDECNLIRTSDSPSAETESHSQAADAHESEAHASDDHPAEDHPPDDPAAHDHSAHDHSTCDHAAHAHEESDVNLHTWVSPREAAKQVRVLARKLGQQDPARAETYAANADAYARRLEELAAQMEEASQSFTNRNIVTGHASFDYLARDLKLNVVATLRVIPGETGSASELAHVIDTVRRTRAAAVFWEPPFGDRVAETVARETGVPIYPLNPFNTDAGLPKPTTAAEKRRMYEDVMIQNLDTLQKALAPTSRPASVSADAS